jgi:ATP-dependent RNA helicase DDX43
MNFEDEWLENEPVAVATLPAPHVSIYQSREYRPSRGRGGRGRSNENYRREQDNPSTSYRRNYEGNDGEKKNISVPSQMVGRIIGKGGSKIRELEQESQAKIKIGEATGDYTTVSLIGSSDAISKVESLINDLIDTGARPRDSNNDSITSSGSGDFFKKNDSGVEVIDWGKLNAFYDEHQQNRWKNLPDIIKDFYKEDPKVAAMSAAEVTRWRRANNDIQVRRTFDNKPGLRPVPNPVVTFEQAFQHYPEILDEIYKQGFQHPSPIQSQAWPVLLRGEDLIGIAQTGTGKTLAFLLPALIHIDGQTIPREQREGPTVLILAPTRELALQIDKEVSKYQ